MENKKTLANVKDTYIPPQGWGIEPMRAAQHHKQTWKDVVQKALDEAGIGLENIDIISFSQGAGLAPCLHVGLNLAKELASKNNIPLIGVCHQIAHIEIGKLFSNLRDPVTLYVSGANTQVLAYVEQKYRCFGETMDIGIGNALDKLGRVLGLGFPAGPKIEQEAKGGSYAELPYVVKGMDLSFSGIVTDCLRRYQEYKRTGKFGGIKQSNESALGSVCYSFQETAFAMLTEVTERALAHTGKDEVLLTGGVAANRRLQEMVETMARERGAKSSTCSMEYAGDCGANIAWLGLLQHKAKCNLLSPDKADILPRQRTDDVDVKWL